MRRTILVFGALMAVLMFAMVGPASESGLPPHPAQAQTLPESIVVDKEVVSPEPHYVGEPIVYEVTLTYTSTEPSLRLEYVALIDLLYVEQNWELASWGPVNLPERVQLCRQADNTNTAPLCQWGPLYPGESITLRVTMIPHESGTFQNTGAMHYYQAEPPRGIDITQSSDTVFVEVVERPPKPQTKAECKNGGYEKFSFKNQGECIKAVNHAAPADTTAPETTITVGPEQHSTSQNESATFEFTSGEANSTFECKITSQSFCQAIKGDDVGFWHPCTSPMTYSPLRDDNITFQVRAIDAAGNVDPTPAERIFTVQRPGPSLQITNGPEDRSTINAGSVTFEWTTDGATPVDSYCQFRGPSGWVELFNSCSSPKTYQLIEDGYYVFNVFVEDATGNSTNMERQFAIDTSSS
jgi:hypothetical protein